MSYVNKRKVLDDILSKNISRIKMIEQIESLFRDFDESVFIEKSSYTKGIYWKLSPKLVNLLGNPRSVFFTPIYKNLYIEGFNCTTKKVDSSTVGIDGYIGKINSLIGVGSKIYVSPFPTIIDGKNMFKVYV